MNCIVNVDSRWAIGRSGELLVHISEDLKRFRTLTQGGTVILGRKTLQTFPGGRPLKNRRNIILSRQEGLAVEGAEILRDLSQLPGALQNTEPDSVWVIGGASVYKELVPQCKFAYVTRTFTDGHGDRFFPDLDSLPQWSVVERSPILEENGIKFQYVTYRNQQISPELSSRNCPGK